MEYVFVHYLDVREGIDYPPPKLNEKFLEYIRKSFKLKYIKLEDKTTKKILELEDELTSRDYHIRLIDNIDDLGDNIIEKFRGLSYNAKYSLWFFKDLNILEYDILLKVGIDINVTKNGYTLLYFAVSRDNLELVEKLLSLGANVNALTFQGNTPLHYGAEFGNITILKLLLDYDANVNIKNKRGITPIFFSIFKDNNECFDELISFGSDLTITENNHTLLYLALKRKNLYIAYELIKRGADVNEQDKEGNTFLHHIIKGKNYLAIDGLKKYNPDYYIENNQGERPVDILGKIENI